MKGHYGTSWGRNAWDQSSGGSASAELSVGVITAFCGAPFFVYLLRTRYRATL